MLPSSKEPKYLSLTRQLKSQIEQGTLAPGDKMPTFVEMRAQYGVMPTTVDRIYSLLEREGLIVREQGRGTFVKARQTRPRTGIVGLRGINFSLSPHPYYSHLLDGFQSVASAAGVELLLLNEASEIKWERMDGVITYSRIQVGSSQVLPALPAGMPGVSALMADAKQISVIADEYQGAYDLTKHLLELGHTRIAYLFDPLSQRRLSAYRDALRDAGIEPYPAWEHPLKHSAELDWTYGKWGHGAMAQWLANDWKKLGCTALLTQNDDAAIGAIQALTAAGYRVPHDVSVAGFDGTEVGSFFQPPLTSVSVPLREIGATAMELLLDQINGGNPKISTVMLPTSVLPRLSTTPPRQ